MDRINPQNTFQAYPRLMRTPMNGTRYSSSKMMSRAAALLNRSSLFPTYACLSAANGLQALDIVDRVRVDLVLMDLSMPALDGYQTVERMRERPGYANTPIVAVSGHAESAQRDLALRSGFTEYLSKPFRPKELVQLIDRLLSNTAQREDEPGMR